MITFDIESIIASMTLEEKASLCSGDSFWTTKAIERLGIEPLLLTDGPHGLRKQRIHTESAPDLHDSIPATCFPSAAGLASTWNRNMLELTGKTIGLEARAEGVAVLLGPGINMKRSPLCGRNFEYFSEDPFLTGALGAAHVNGVQLSGIGGCIKHFAVNNQEANRMVVDAVVSERALREIYLPAFEMIVKESKPWMVMCAYNKVNGEFCSQNKRLLNDILRDEWQYEGVLVTDWGACDDRVKGLLNGQDLEMPGSLGVNDQKIVHAINNGILPESVLDQAIRRWLSLYQKAINTLSKPAPQPDLAKHHQTAVRVAEESLVLLKNSNRHLPLPLPSTNTDSEYAFIGDFARTTRYQGGGSSHINATFTTSILESAKPFFSSDSTMAFSPGYDIREKECNEAMIADALKTARQARHVVLFAGLTDAEESEGFDRKTLSLPPNQVALIQAFADQSIPFTLVLTCGAPVVVPCQDRIPAILYTALPGQGGSEAIVNTLFGHNNPSGKLAETFPARLEDTPCYLHFPGSPEKVTYNEDIWIGYRYYDAVKKVPLFPFGHGLSYSEFKYESMQLSSPLFSAHPNSVDELVVSVTLTNISDVAGSETIQLYVHYPQEKPVRPIRELRGFEKVMLAPSETKTVHFHLKRRDFCRFDETLSDFWADSGTVHIETGSSSRDIRCRKKLIMEAPRAQKPLSWNSQISQLLEDKRTKEWITPLVPDIIAAYGHYEPDSAEAIMMEVQAMEMPLRNLVRHCPHIVSEKDLTPYIDEY